MTEDRDPALQTLFAQAKQELPGEAFSESVMERIDSARRRAVIAWVCFVLLLVPGAWLLAAPIQSGVDLITESLTVSLIDVSVRWVAQVAAPLNNVAALFALGLIALRMVYRKVFRRS